MNSHVVLTERDLEEKWLRRTIRGPGRLWIGDDGNEHYAKATKWRDNRVLHGVVNKKQRPYRVVTVFLDRRLKE